MPRSFLQKATRRILRTGTPRKRQPQANPRIPSPNPASGTAVPIVTVGITTHQDAQRVGRCLESVAAQSLGTSYIEVLVVDDGSTDATVKTASAYKDSADWAGFTVARHRGTGSPSKGRNTILDAARGEFVFFLDADDYLGDQALNSMVAQARETSADLVVGRYVGVNRSAPNVLPPKDPKVKGYHAGWLNSLHVQKLFRTDFARRLPYRFNESLIYASDHPFMVAAFLYADKVALVEDVDCYFITLEEPDSQHRVHVSRAEVPAHQQLQFIHDCFGLMALARGQGGELAQRAGRMRADYWNRLLKLHIPVLVLRKRESQDRAILDLASQAKALSELYGAQTSRTRLVPEAQQFLAALDSAEEDTVRQAASAARGGGDSLTS
ncbi:glycosyltransferase family 2 protein [Nesterenkonia massiliensis]|uniref:glycosyltransferase family 2 protein n=1 Tax=Nesterenkonia massiliensis TaxID=1232429 RepID=UPI0004084794|nr:glycosyltransferase family 2 protein [Nesterenkonia massiliensis]